MMEANLEVTTSMKPILILLSSQIALCSLNLHIKFVIIYFQVSVALYLSNLFNNFTCYSSTILTVITTFLTTKLTSNI